MNDLLVKLPLYEGPLDLLLHLIKKNEVDLNEIPVALITAQYLEYLDLMEAMNVEVAADFLLMAATLTQIKSKLLLPHEKDDDDETDLTDEIKAAIIDPLLAHLSRGNVKDFKEAAEALKSRQFLNSDVFVRGAGSREEEESTVGQTRTEVSLFDLMDAFRKLAGKKPEIPTLNFVVETKTIGERIDEIRGLLKARKNCDFGAVCAGDASREQLFGTGPHRFFAALPKRETGGSAYFSGRSGGRHGRSGSSGLLARLHPDLSEVFFKVVGCGQRGIDIQRLIQP